MTKVKVIEVEEVSVEYVPEMECETNCYETTFYVVSDQEFQKIKENPTEESVKKIVGKNNQIKPMDVPKELVPGEEIICVSYLVGA